MTTIPVQTQFLRMAGIGVESAPTNPANPHQLEGPGVHLRWAFPTRRPDGSPVPMGWPQAGFVLYRRAAAAADLDHNIDMPGADDMRDDATLPLAGGATLEFDPEVLAETRRRVPGTWTDLELLLDAYPLYVTLRFDRPVRQVDLLAADRPLQERGPRLVAVRAHDGQDAVDEATHSGGAGETGVRLSVRGDHVTHLRIRVKGIRIYAISYATVALTTELEKWTRIAVLPPETDWTAVRDRVPAAFQRAYERGWPDLAAELVRLFDATDRRRRWLREFTETGAPVGRARADGEVAPAWSYSLQQQILLFGIDPFIARLLGLLHADTSAEAASGDAFDYLVVATFEVPRSRPSEPGDPVPLLPGFPGAPDPQELLPPNGTVGWITYHRSTRTHPPLAAPELTVAETTPARAFLPDPATGTLTERARVGLAWTLRPEGDGGPLDAGAVRYDVEVRAGGEAAWRLLTPGAKVVVAATVDELGTPSWPEHFFVDRRGAGAHEYRVYGIDVFGRRSRPSAALAVTIADEVGPPPPVNIWARYLDPADPYLAADERPLGEGLLVRIDHPRRPYEAGSDATGFELRAAHGARDRALDWRAPATWPAPVAAVPRQAKLTGAATAVEEIAATDPAEQRFRVTTDIAGGASSGTDRGCDWATRPGYLLVGEQEYPVVAVETGRAAVFTVAWPAALGLPDPAPDRCTWYRGYQAFLPGYDLPLDGRASVTGAVAVGAVDAAGNRGRISAAAAFQRVDRAPPAAAGAFTLGVDELLAGEPDAYGRSRFTLTWQPAADGARHLVLRGLDSAVLARHGSSVADGRAMDAAALKALADDPLAEPAFSQLTPEPIDGTTFTDETLEGFGSNRYFYRLRTVSLAGTRGELGESTPPVAVPDVVPPRRPRLIRALGGDGQVTLTFTPNREWDADHYAVYRAPDAAAAADPRRMTRIGTVEHDPAAPALTFADDGSAGPPPEPRTDHRYRVTAVDRAGNESAPSRVVVARCFSTAPPAVPRPSAERSRAGTAVRVSWPEPEPGVVVLVQRRAGPAAPWRAVSTWLAPGARRFDDGGLDPAAEYGYRLKAMSPSRVVAESDPIEVPPR